MSCRGHQVVVRCLMLLGLGVFAIDTNDASAQETEGRRYAVLVGVKEYDRNQLRSLPYPENDVTELAEVLKTSGFRRVELLTQTEGAKRSRALPLAKTIRETLLGVLEDRSQSDLVVVAFAGHGVQFRGEKEHYFCPMDAVLTDRSTLISLSNVYKQLEQSKAGTKLLIVDACRNDPLAGNARDGGDAKLESLTRPQLPDPPGGVAAFFSCSAGQRAFEDESLKHGVFFHHVILGLKGEARLKKRNEVTWDSLVAYVKAEVPDTVKDLFGNTTRQIPEHKGELRGGATLISFPKPSGTDTIPKPTSPSSTTTTQVPSAKEITSKSTGMKLTLIPAGEFKMGSTAADVRAMMQINSTFKEEHAKDEQPQHTVKISRPFYMGVTEVTQAEYESVMGANPSQFSKTGSYSLKVSGLDTSRFPVEYVSWFDVVEFCNKLSAKDSLSPCYTLTNMQRDGSSIKSAIVSPLNGTGYRLPTEAEWEYTCRAGTTTLWHSGSTLTELNSVGWWGAYATPAGNSLERPNRVGQKTANAFGLFDMHGNVWEWCDDVYDESLYTKRSGTTIDPRVASGSESRILRGGSWYNYPWNTRTADRSRNSPDNRNYLNGFRVVVSEVGVRSQ